MAIFRRPFRLPPRARLVPSLGVTRTRQTEIGAGIALFTTKSASVGSALGIAYTKTSSIGGTLARTGATPARLAAKLAYTAWLEADPIVSSQWTTPLPVPRIDE